MSVSSTVVAPRPASVSVAIVLGWVSVLLDVIGGVSLFLLAGDDDVLAALGTGTTSVQSAALGSLVVAVALSAVLYALGRGSNVARGLVSAVMLLRLGLGIWMLLAFGTHHLTEALLTVAIALVTLALLWNPRAGAFFATNRTSTGT